MQTELITIITVEIFNIRFCKFVVTHEKKY